MKWYEKDMNMFDSYLHTANFAGFHVKKRVKNGGSHPSLITKIGVSREKFSISTSSSINFC